MLSVIMLNVIRLSVAAPMQGLQQNVEFKTDDLVPATKVLENPRSLIISKLYFISGHNQTSLWEEVVHSVSPKCNVFLLYSFPFWGGGRQWNGTL